ncbi:universal stress protein [Pseudonocardia asaccharolytica DSM 44247 = NBRC 16224]|uniref:Universal stress protein n=1 Tax=Pseudonocardia asaccharolytica DSM 44247 = NBRC 16224 TaxID=1123024 RepID=A0A511D0K0_9PSEU|nr:universal stress protein [Pseudonocardia asaccharolytica DSM 44247 = NBRC 16224]
MTPTRRRVLVGVTGSLTNLQAIRTAVDVARERDAVLYAVHVWEPGRRLERPPAAAPASGNFPRVLHVHKAFSEALGGLPRDVDVRLVVVEGQPEARLARLGDKDTDLLVVGATTRTWRRPRLGDSVAGYCTRHARCPVLIVPPHEMARAALARRDRGLVAVLTGRGSVT